MSDRKTKFTKIADLNDLREGDILYVRGGTRVSVKKARELGVSIGETNRSVNGEELFTEVFGGADPKILFVYEATKQTERKAPGDLGGGGLDAFVAAFAPPESSLVYAQAFAMELPAFLDVLSEDVGRMDETGQYKWNHYGNDGTGLRAPASSIGHGMFAEVGAALVKDDPLLKLGEHFDAWGGEGTGRQAGKMLAALADAPTHVFGDFGGLTPVTERGSRWCCGAETAARLLGATRGMANRRYRLALPAKFLRHAVSLGVVPLRPANLSFAKAVGAVRLAAVARTLSWQCSKKREEDAVRALRFAFAKIRESQRLWDGASRKLARESLWAQAESAFSALFGTKGGRP